MPGASYQNITGHIPGQLIMDFEAVDCCVFEKYTDAYKETFNNTSLSFIKYTRSVKASSTVRSLK